MLGAGHSTGRKGGQSGMHLGQTSPNHRSDQMTRQGEAFWPRACATVEMAYDTAIGASIDATLFVPDKYLTE
jgi:hypothetical protein